MLQLGKSRYCRNFRWNDGYECHVSNDALRIVAPALAEMCGGTTTTGCPVSHNTLRIVTPVTAKLKAQSHVTAIRRLPDAKGFVSHGRCFKNIWEIEASWA